MAASRVEQMEIDANELGAILLQSYGDRVRNVIFDDANLRFEAKDGVDRWSEVSICFSDDYPDGTVICGLNDRNNFMHATALEAFEFVAREIFLSTLHRDGASAGGEGLTRPFKTSCQIPAAESKRSRLNSPAMSPGHTVDGDFDSDGEYYHEPPIDVDQFLSRDVSACQDWGGDDCCTFYHHAASLETAHIILRLRIAGVVGENLAQAWGIEAGKRICVQLLDVSVVNYRKARRPEVKVSQESSALKPSACLRQMERIVGEYLDKHWNVESESAYENSSVLKEVCIYALDRLPSLCDFCVICDQPHEFMSMLVPSVCNRDLCVFAYETFGVMADFDIQFSAQQAVVDLLLRMFRYAAISARHELILNPFPMIPDPIKRAEMAISNRASDYDKLLSVVKKIPCTVSLDDLYRRNVEAKEGEQKETSDPLLFPLIRWVITSNRTYLMKLPESDRLSFLKTPHQFLMMIDSPAKEAAFREAKKNHGSSIFAFHGSPFENWHSILRRGLIVASGTKLQMFGNAHGNGIYLSTQLQTSWGYAWHRSAGAATSNVPPCEDKSDSHDCSGGGRFLDIKKHYGCIALCEVVPMGALKKPRDDIWVLEDPNLVCTRFFFLYELFTMYNNTDNVNCNDEAVLQEIRRAVKKFRTTTDGDVA